MYNVYVVDFPGGSGEVDLDVRAAGESGVSKGWKSIASSLMHPIWRM